MASTLGANIQERRNRRRMVLVADDDEATRELLTELLEDRGYTVTSVENGDLAMEMIRTQEVETVLLDVMMPRRSGFAVCRALKSAPETRLLPVVLITGLSDTEDLVQGIECGADDFLSKPINREQLVARVASLVRLRHFTKELECAETVLTNLALGIEAKDPFTEGHCERLSRYAVALGRLLDLPEEQVVALRRAGIVHDIGKLAVPQHILLKSGPLTAEERKIMEQHPGIGERICAPMRSFHWVLPIIRHHHERLDGSGYPDGLENEDIPLTARILTVVDVYDSLSTDRPYRAALSPQRAFEVMREEAGRGWWDPSVVDLFASIVLKESVTTWQPSLLG